MKISDKFKQGRAVLSFEVFPPKKDMPHEVIYNTLEELAKLSPDFISVTYGSGGSNPGITCEVVSKIIHEHNIDALAHITCINSTKEQVKTVLDDFAANGIENVLALRGDRVPDVEPKNDFKYSSELTLFIKQNSNFSVAGACYPETHCDSANATEDILNLRHKIDAGVENLITQLFFDNSAFYNFRERCACASINVPISAGIMPVTNKKQIERMVSMCGASLPAKFSKIMQKYGDNPEALRDAGIAYAIEQIVDLLANDVDGIHIYTMNNAVLAKQIYDAIKKLL